MPKIFCALALCLTLAGCPTIDQLTLTGAELSALSDNTESALTVQQLFSKYAFEAARGDLSLLGLTYDPPTAANQWTGTISGSGGVFPFGVGDLNLQFVVSGDSGPVDPYLTDLSGDAQVDIDVVADFLGVYDGQTVDISTDFNASTLLNTANDVIARVNGLFTIDYAGYVADIQAFNVDVTIDLAQDEITSILGDLTASIDIPGFILDADLVIEGLGDRVNIGLEIANSILDYLINLSSLLP